MISLNILSSAFNNKKSVQELLDDEITLFKKFEKITQEFGFINSIDSCSHYIGKNHKSNSTILFIYSGGTEKYAKMLIEATENPILIVANSKQNSLAASLEILAVYREAKSIKHIYYESIDELSEEISRFIFVVNAIDEINNSAVGLIGEPSNWLLTSKGIESFGIFKTKLIKIDIEELTESVKEITLPISTSKIESDYQHKCVCTKDIKNSSKVYDSLTHLITKYQFSALTVRCFDLLKYNYTACMALSMLNDENIVSGCEGDIFALFSMLVANKLVNEPVWMANPASINKKENTLILAHCTIPSKMLSSLDKSKLTTHMESGLSVAIQGPLKMQDVTILRIGGNFNKILFSTGKIVDTDMRDPALCRTQVKIQLDCDVNDWMNKSLGNHQILAYGNISKLLTDFCSFTGIKIIQC